MTQYATVPVAFLMTLSSLADKCVRPVAEMLVMQQDLWPVPLPVVTASLAVMTFSFVYAMLASATKSDGPNNNTKKD